PTDNGPDDNRHAPMPTRKTICASLSPARAIAYGTLAVGTLDGLDAIFVFGLLRGATPQRIFQGIAYGLLGRASLGGGMPAALFSACSVPAGASGAESFSNSRTITGRT